MKKIFLIAGPFKGYYVLIILLISIFVAFIAFGFDGTERGIRDAKLPPTYPGAYAIQQGFDYRTKSKYVAYRVRLEFPATEIINFYDTQLAMMRCKIYKEDGYGEREWMAFDEFSGNWKKTYETPARYISTWIDNDKKIRFILVLDYSHDLDTGKEETKVLSVDFRLAQFFDFRELKKKLEVKQE